LLCSRHHHLILIHYYIKKYSQLQSLNTFIYLN